MTDDNLYRDFILEHYREPHNRGVLEPHDLHFADSNPTCGDEMSMTLRLDQASSAFYNEGKFSINGEVQWSSGTVGLPPWNAPPRSAARKRGTPMPS